MPDEVDNTARLTTEPTLSKEQRFKFAQENCENIQNLDAILNI